MKGINLLFLIAALALPVSAFAKRGEGYTDSRTMSDEDRELYGNLNTLVSYVREAKPDPVVPAPEVVRPKQISFDEQRNLIILAAVEMRPDWYLYMRKKIADGESLRGEEALTALYFRYLEIQEQVDREQSERLGQLVDEAKQLDRYEQARLKFSRAILHAREVGKSAEDLRSLREEVYGEMENPASEDDVIYNRDFEKAERAARASEKTLKRLLAESEKQSIDYSFNVYLLNQAISASVRVPAELVQIFKRPDGFPVVDRAGHFYAPEEWKAMKRALPKPDKSVSILGRIRMACANLLSKPVAKR